MVADVFLCGGGGCFATGSSLAVLALSTSSRSVSVGGELEEGGEGGGVAPLPFPGRRVVVGLVPFPFCACPGLLVPSVSAVCLPFPSFLPFAAAAVFLLLRLAAIGFSAAAFLSSSV